MPKKSFYIDTCIYLNLWQKEGNKKFGIPYWKLAEDFFEKFDNEDTIFYYSGFVLRELTFKLTKGDFEKKKALFESSPNFKKTRLSPEEFNSARRIERELNYKYGFFDIIHMLLALKTKSILVTRDNNLIELAKRYKVIVKRPEEIL